jgi:predicted HAD superfamily Cof-like phosphohydrolase
MTKVFTDVSVFLSACGQEVPSKPSAPSELSTLYMKLIQEEFIELFTAIKNDNNTEQLDGCFDLIWVVVGYMKARGWDCDGAWDEGARSNLAKIDPVTGNVIRREDGKILKPEGWIPPNFAKFVA